MKHELRKDRETPVSHGIGHGGFEVVLVLGTAYVTYDCLCGDDQYWDVRNLIGQAAAKAPEQAEALVALWRIS